MQWLYDNYPRLFRTRRDCFNQLFCTIGNGYDWVNGRLVRICGASTESDPTPQALEARLVDGKAHQHINVPGYSEFYWSFLVPALTHTGERIIHKDLAKDFAFLWNYPEDIQPDWMAGIEECKALLRVDGILNDQDEFADSADETILMRERRDCPI